MSKLTLFDLEVLVECLKYSMRFANENLIYTKETRIEVLNNVINFLNSKELVIDEKLTSDNNDCAVPVATQPPPKSAEADFAQS